MPFLGTILFTAFGKQITVKHLLLAILGLVVAVALFFAVRWVSSYFKHIHDIEVENSQLHQQVGQLEEQKKTVIQTNKDNEATRVTQNQITASSQNIATQERQATVNRTAQYKEISHAIQDAPTAPVQPGHPAVAPVISNTLDGLWGPAPENHK